MADETAAAPKEGGKRLNGLIPMLAGPLITGVIVMGGGAYLMQMQNKALKEALATVPGSPESKEAQAKASPKESQEDDFFDLDEFLVNLANEGGGRYLRTTMTLRFRPPSARDAIKKDQPKIRDLIIGILTSHSTEEIASLQGKEKLKAEILSQVTKMAPESGINGVFFQSFTVQ